MIIAWEKPGGCNKVLRHLLGVTVAILAIPAGAAPAGPACATCDRVLLIPRGDWNCVQQRLLAQLSGTQDPILIALGACPRDSDHRRLEPIGRDFGTRAARVRQVYLVTRSDARCFATLIQQAKPHEAVTKFDLSLCQP